MKRIMLFAALAAMLVVSAIPVAFAQDRNDRQEDRFDARQDRFEDNGFFFDGDRFEEDGFFFDGDRFDENDFDGNDFDGNDIDENDFDGNGGVSQDNEQDVESGDADQAFEVTGGGDNSNACQNVQGINNTGNAVSNTSVLQYANEDVEVEVEDQGNFEISPETAIECDQQVNQAASAFGGK